MKFAGSFTAALLLAAFTVAAVPAPSFAEGMIDGELGYDKGLYYRSEDGRFKIKQNFRIQFRGDILDTNEDGSDTETDLMIRRMRLKFGGHAYEKWIKYGFQLAGSIGRDGRDNDLNVRDAFLIFAKNPAADLKVGRYKAPFDIEVLNSSSTLQFVDRSHVKSFVIGVDAGDGFSVGGVLGNMFAYRGGLFQLNDEKFSGGDNILLAGRVQANICCGELKYSSGSFTSGGDYKISPNFSKVPVFAIGVGGFYYNGEDVVYTHSDTVNYTLPVTSGLNLNSRAGVTVDMIAKYERANLEAAFYYGSTKTEKETGDDGNDDKEGGAADNADTFALDTNSNGNFAYRVQGGFMITPELEIATRWAMSDYDKDSDENDTWEWTTGLNYYLAKHRAKVQVDYTYGNEKDGISADRDKKTNTFRAQVQLHL